MNVAPVYAGQMPPTPKQTLSSRLLENAIEKGPLCFLNLMEGYLNDGGDPNLKFEVIMIEDNAYGNPNCFHLVYLYWIYLKYPDDLFDFSPLDKETNNRFKIIINKLLNDPRINLRATFSEYHLFMRGHFHKPNVGYLETDKNGFLLEGMNIAHYAVALGDVKMIFKLLDKDPNLIHSVCCITKGKNLLDYHLIDEIDHSFGNQDWAVSFSKIYFPEAKNDIRDVYDLCLKLHSDTEFSGNIANVWLNQRLIGVVERVAKVNLMHLAARIGNQVVCSTLRRSNIINHLTDSSGKRPIDYLDLLIEEGLIDREQKSALRACLKTEHLVNLSPNPECFKILQREGYELFYDTRTKLAVYAREKLTKDSLQKATNRAVSFKVDEELPNSNRAALADYVQSGRDRGHLFPAGDAVSSKKSMQDSFLLTNICPQDPSFNRGYWKKVEEKIRAFVESNDVVEVFSGPLYLPQMYNDGVKRVCYEVIGSNDIAVPTHFFKVIYFHNGRTTVKSYVFPHMRIDPNTPLSKFEQSLTDIQRLSGILFCEWRR